MTVIGEITTHTVHATNYDGYTKSLDAYKQIPPRDTGDS